MKRITTLPEFQEAILIFQVEYGNNTYFMPIVGSWCNYKYGKEWFINGAYFDTYNQYIDEEDTPTGWFPLPSDDDLDYE